MGRRPVIFIAAIFSLIPMIGAAVCQNWIQLLICRLLLGIGIGCKAAVGRWTLVLPKSSVTGPNDRVVPIYAAETAPTSIRGALIILLATQHTTTPLCIERIIR